MGFFNKTLIINLFPYHSQNAIKSIINRALKNKEIIRITASFYCLDPSFTHTTPHPFLLAQQIYEHSFISMESALAHHSLIPEALYQVSSTTSQRSKVVLNPFGSFSYTHIPCKEHYAGVNLEKITAQDSCFIATPVRAIADMIYKNKEITWKTDGLNYLTESLRIDEDDLQKLNADDFNDVITSFKSKRVKEYLKKLKKELHL